MILKHFNWRKVATIHEGQASYEKTMNVFRKMIRLENMTLITSESFKNSAIDNLYNIQVHIAFHY